MRCVVLEHHEDCCASQSPSAAAGMSAHEDAAMVQLSALLCLVPLTLENPQLQVRPGGEGGGARRTLNNATSRSHISFSGT